jgi:hypothetical protein
MNRAIRLRRILVATLILTALTTTFPVATASAMTTRERTYTYTPDTICPVDWRQGTWAVKRLITCAANHYGVSVDMALYVANRESHFRPSAYNGASCAQGLFQHLCTYWPGRAHEYGFKGWSAFNARANTIVTMKMVRRYGWSPWGL